MNRVRTAIAEEHYKIIAGNKTLIFANNKTIIELRELKDFPWTWKLIEGELHNMCVQETITEAIEIFLRGKTKPGRRAIIDPTNAATK